MEKTHLNLLKKFTEDERRIFWMLVVGVFGCLVFGLLCLTKILPFGYLIGFALGTTIEVLCYIFLSKSSYILVNSKIEKAGLGYLFFIIRFALYALGLVLAGLCEYVWKEPNILCLFGVFPAYLPMQIIVFFVKDNKNVRSI